MIAFVVIPYDLEKLKQDVLSQSKAEYIICAALHEFSETQIAQLQHADSIYFVTSGTSMCSTAYQMLLFSAFPILDEKKCRLLKLDDAEIPGGFPMLQKLPESKPA